MGNFAFTVDHLWPPKSINAGLNKMVLSVLARTWTSTGANRLPAKTADDEPLGWRPI